MLRNCGNSFPFCNETKTKSQEIYNLRTAKLKAVRVFQIIQKESDLDKQKRWSDEKEGPVGQLLS